MSKSQLAVRLNDRKKNEFEKNAEAIGLTASTAIKMMISQFNYDKRFNFPINRKDSLNKIKKLPKEVERAMLLAKSEEDGLIKDTSRQVKNFDDLYKR